MTLLQTILAFIVAIGVLVIVHELGHYLVARWCGVKVLCFSVGMGKIVFSRRFGADQTEWAVSVLPFGGYVKMLDAREHDLADISEADWKREFTSQPVWKRIAIVAAGPLANFLLAIGLFSAIYSHGIPEPVAKLRAVPEASVAHRAGLRGGERVTAINGESIKIWSELRWKIMQLAVDGVPARLDVEIDSRSAPGGKTLRTVTLGLDSINTSDLEGDFLGKLGLDPARPRPVLGKLGVDGPASKAGLREGDLILEINGNVVPDGLAFIDIVRASPARELEMLVQRGTDQFTQRVTPEVFEDDGRQAGRIRAEVAMAPEMIIARSGPIEALQRGAQKTWDTTTLTLSMLGKMLVGELSLKNITGPITIADYAGQTARVGFISYLSFLAFISISLGVMNLLPIPMLDGGHLLYYSLEFLTGRKIPERLGEIAQRAGVGILMILMAVAIFNDIARLMS